MAQLPDTRYSLLARLADPADALAWSEFVTIYNEAIYRYSRGRGLQDSDACDVIQKVLLVTHQAVSDWKPTGRVGSFRAWLVQTAHRICLRTIRDAKHCDRAIGGTSVLEQLHELVDQNGAQDIRQTDLNDNDWQRWAFCWAAGLVQREVNAGTWSAFWLTSVEGIKPEEAAAKLEVRLGTIYTAKCRVIARIRQRVQELSQETEI